MNNDDLSKEYFLNLATESRKRKFLFIHEKKELLFVV